MENKLEVGMHCYDKTNRKLGIGKIFTIEEKNNYGVSFNNTFRLISMGNLVASFNIIDLIEIGDYVNNKKVTSIGRDAIYFGSNADYILKSKPEQIKSIVTKESFKSVEYEV